MLCAYFRYIDLEGVYEDLDAFAEHDSKKLSNIPDQFSDTLYNVFEDLSHVTCHEDERWKKLKAIDLAAEVGDVIEHDLEHMAAYAKIRLPNKNSSAVTVLERLISLSISASFGEFDYYQKNSLLAYQYDALCWFHSKGKTLAAFETYELILRNFGEMSAIFALDISFKKQSEAVSNIARERAQKRHATTNKKKTDLLAEWDKTSTEYKSRADFCRIVSKRDGLKERTLQEWIQVHEKNQATG